MEFKFLVVRINFENIGHQKLRLHTEMKEMGVHQISCKRNAYRGLNFLFGS